METAQERALQERQAWPLDIMASFDTGNNSSSSSSSSSDCFLFEWEPQLSYFGVLGDADIHELFPLYMESPEAASTAAAVLPAAAQNAVAVPQELDDLLLNFWDANSYGDVGKHVTFNSSCIVHENSNTTVPLLYHDGGDDLLSSIFSKGPTFQEKIASLHQAEPPSSSSSNCHADPRSSDFCGAQLQTTATPTAARAPAFRRTTSSKRLPPEETEMECSQSSKRRKVAAGVVYPFTVVKPDGLDGGATLADINARILMRPARPVRHPVGEFACAPRISADKPGLSGKTVSSFTRLHTPGRGTITIIRTRG